MMWLQTLSKGYAWYFHPFSRRYLKPYNAVQTLTMAASSWLYMNYFTQNINQGFTSHLSPPLESISWLFLYKKFNIQVFWYRIMQLNNWKEILKILSSLLEPSLSWDLKISTKPCWKKEKNNYSRLEKMFPGAW